MTNQQLPRQLVEFAIAFNKMSHQLLTAVRPEGMTPLHFELLHFLLTEQVATLTQIAQCVGMSLPNTSREIRKLQEKQLVGKTADKQDKRVQYVSLSPAGLELMQASSLKLEQLVKERYDGLNETEAAAVSEAIAVLSGKLL